jgi:hypothetical protein
MKLVSRVLLVVASAGGLVAVASASDRESGDAARDHWAFQPVRAPAIPDVKQLGWCSSPIDRFVLASLEAAGMGPSEPADRVTLIRRATFDLIGLPPSKSEVDAFVGDPADDAQAFARVVDRLLDSPLYGQRWGRYWLDVARYADTKGYVRLKEERRFHHAYTYRDWVIRAFNTDMPYDRFVVEQLAADLLPKTDQGESLAALGFLTLGRQFTGNTFDIIDDRIDVVTRGLLGLTVSCARCHDHMYDPIPTADYYSLYGVFETSEEPVVPPLAGPVPPDAASQEFQRKSDELQKAIEDYEPRQYTALVDDFRRRSGQYLAAAIEGYVPLQQPLPKVAGETRQVVVNRWIDFLGRAGADDAVFGLWHALAELKPEEFAASSVEVIQQGRQSTNRLVRDRLLREPPKSLTDVAGVYGALLSEIQERWQTLTSSTAAAASATLERLADPAEEQLRQVLYRADSPVAVSLQESFAEYLYDGPIHDEITKRRGALAAHLANTAHAPPRAHTLVERPALGDPRILVRGNPGRPGESVSRHFLSVLAHGDSKRFAPNQGRLDLARAIVDRDNPLTARVLVNRVWANHFGAGLVRTPSNFGLRGQEPTHAELLDHLAGRFVEEGWSIKKLHRWIMLSSVYRQSSRYRADCATADPENRLLWRMNRRRLDFEALRDSMLAVAGRLDTSAGGPSFDLTAAGANRRTVYALVDRQALPGMLPTFDFASPDTHSPERYTTTVPQQALLMMNSPLITDLARAFAARPDVKGIAAPSPRAAYMLELARSRAPSKHEIEQVLKFIAEEQAEKPDQAFDAWESLAQVLLLSNEFSYVD